MTIKTPQGARPIGPGHPCFVVAEMSANHHGNYDTAVEIIRAAAKAGADAIKVQTYTPDTITLDCDSPYFRIGGAENPEEWQGKTLYQLYQTAYTPWEWQPKLKAEAEALGLAFFSMSADVSGVEFLESIGVNFYKVGSYELIHLPLLKRLGQTGKPVIVSVGYGSEEEIWAAVKTLRASGAGAIALLHCVTAYDRVTPRADLHLSNIRDLAERFGVVSGFSENAGGIESAVLAVAAGAALVEKHLILDHNNGGPDAVFSITPVELEQMVREIRQMEQALGSVHYGPISETEKYNRRYRPSLFIARDLTKGEVLTPDNVRCIRPAAGLPPREYERILGKRVNRNVGRGTPLSWNLIVDV